MRAVVAIPLKQGLIFNRPVSLTRRRQCVAIPLKQGLIFNPKKEKTMNTETRSQSL